MCVCVCVCVSKRDLNALLHKLSTNIITYFISNELPKVGNSLVAQTVKNLPAVWEPWVRSLGWEDPLEEGTATDSSVLAWRIPMDRGAW